jgi:hypothetical protein
MSGNIKDTNVTLIERQVYDLISDLDDLIAKNEDINNWSKTLEHRYKHLSKTSNTLFKFIIKNYNTPKFDKTFFNKTLTLMLDKIGNIQDSKISQENASEHVGTHLAKTFIPQLK